MSQQELLNRVVHALEDSGCRYMITGSFASSLQGEPRLSHDIDLVVDIPLASVDRLSAHFPSPEFYFQKDELIDAIKSQSMFSVLHVVEGDKVDFWMITSDPFDAERFKRRIQQTVFGLIIIVSAPEDTIVAKLRWSKLSGGSEKQVRDALRVYEVQRDTMDLEYIRKWIARLGLETEWSRLLAEADG